MSLALVAVFRGMTREALSQLERGSTIQEPCDGATIFAPGDPSDAVYSIIGDDSVILNGPFDRNGKVLMVEMLRVDKIFGEIAVIDGSPRTATAVAEGRVRLVKIRQAAFLAALTNCPTLGEALCRMMAQRLRRPCELLE